MTSEELERKKVRAAHTTSATWFMGQADALIETTTINADELALLQTNLSTKLTMLETLNAAIVELTPEDQLKEEIGRADEYSEKMQRTLLLIRKALKPPPPTDGPPHDPPQNPLKDPPRDSNPHPHHQIQV